MIEKRKKRRFDCKKVAKFSDDSGILAAYYRDIRRFNNLTKEEENDCFEKYRNGDLKARERIIECNQKFVVSCARKFGNEDNLLDLISEGNIGLMKAIDTFDHKSGYKFITYAIHYVLRSIRDFVVCNQIIHKSSLHKTSYILEKIVSDFMCEKGRNPLETEIMDELFDKYNIKITDKRDLYDIKYYALDFDIEDDGQENIDSNILYAFVDKFSDFNTAEITTNNDYNKYLVEKLLHILNDIEKYIVELYYGIGQYKQHTLRDISVITDYSYERVRQILISSVKTLQEYHKKILK
jgi:RNA polymerase sigma factor (sigma-70 family)